MTKVATIERVTNVSKHPNADRLEVLDILGYQCVTGDKFVAGDLVVFIHPDSVVPETEQFEFMRSRNFRVRESRFRGVWSSGLVVPVPSGLADRAEGDEVGEEMGCKHYEKPLAPCLAGHAKGNFPSFLIKTDEHLLKSCPGVLDEFRGLDCYVTVKYDGSSATFYKHEGVFGVCSRNLDLKPDDNNAFWQIANRYDLANKIPDGFAIQGEVYGEGIQKNPLGIKGIELAVFNVFDIKKRAYIDFVDAKAVAERLGVPYVDVCLTQRFSTNLDIKETLKDLQVFADNLKYPNGACAEGIVIRPVLEYYSARLRGRMSVKVISTKYKD